MTLRRITAADALARWAGFDTVVDVRSPAEHAEDRLPGAVNWPVLDDEQRREIGTDYKQASPFDARKRAAVLVTANISRWLAAELPPHGRSWKPLVYCWRGGQRSGSMATVLDQIGYVVHVLDGGYRAFRREVLGELDTLPARLQFEVVCGRTGSGKSRLLHALSRQGAQVLDLEALACHRGSVLGPLPGTPQPAQKAFETQVWQALRGFDPARPVWVESESRTIGRLRVPEALLQRMRASRCLQIEMPRAARVSFLLDDYAHFVTDIESFCDKLDALREVRGAAVVERWQHQVRTGEVAGVVSELLTLHYDPVYERSMQRNFAAYGSAFQLELSDASPASLAGAAAALAREASNATPSDD